MADELAADELSCLIPPQILDVSQWQIKSSCPAPNTSANSILYLPQLTLETLVTLRAELHRKQNPSSASAFQLLLTHWLWHCKVVSQSVLLVVQMCSQCIWY